MGRAFEPWCGGKGRAPGGAGAECPPRRTRPALRKGVVASLLLGRLCREWRGAKCPDAAWARAGSGDQRHAGALSKRADIDYVIGDSAALLVWGLMRPSRRARRGRLAPLTVGAARGTGRPDRRLPPLPPRPPAQDVSAPCHPHTHTHPSPVISPLSSSLDAWDTGRLMCHTIEAS